MLDWALQLNISYQLHVSCLISSELIFQIAQFGGDVKIPLSFVIVVDARYIWKEILFYVHVIKLSVKELSEIRIL